MSGEYAEKFGRYRAGGCREPCLHRADRICRGVMATGPEFPEDSSRGGPRPSVLPNAWDHTFQSGPFASVHRRSWLRCGRATVL